jgi:hypothetical protein
MKNKYRLLLLLLVITLSVLSCRFLSTEEQRERRWATLYASQTAQAGATQTARAQRTEQAMTATSTRTPVPRTARPSPTSTIAEIATPTPIRRIGWLTLRQSDESWVDVYDGPGSKAKWIGELRWGTRWPTVEVFSGMHYWRLMVKGLVELRDIDIEKKVTKCTTHPWYHIEGKELCHAHLWGYDGIPADHQPEGQLAAGMPVEIVGGPIEVGVVSFYEIKTYVWVPESEDDFKLKK